MVNKYYYYYYYYYFNLILKFSFLLLGNITTQSGNLNNNVFLFDTKAYTWMTKFQANPSGATSTDVNTTSTSQSLTGMIIAVCVMGSLIVIISGIAITFCIFKRKISIVTVDKSTTIKIPSSTDHNEIRFQDIIEIPSSTDHNKMR